MGQLNVTTVGFQFKPMINTKFVDRGGGESTSGWLEANHEATGGYAMGMVIRRGITPTISLETGIGYIKRNFKVNVLDVDSLHMGEMNYGLIAYQVPVQGLIYARLTDQLWMNASAGAGVNFLPSNVETGELQHSQRTFRLGRPDWVKMSILANYGFELRTKKDGYFYFGASYDRPLSDLAISRATIERSDGTEMSADGVYTGAYLTIDFRYFFHEDPERKRKIKKKKSSK